MIQPNYRTRVHHFITDPPQAEAHCAQLTAERDPDQVISLDSLPGESCSSIEKMTHPLASCDTSASLSPYLIFLLGEPSLLAFAQRVIYEPRKRVMDTLGIDERSTQQPDLTQTLQRITRFYACASGTQPRRVVLNHRAFLVQEPTRPYFAGQQLITPDFTCHRADQQQIKNKLLRCSLRDDSHLYINKDPLLAAVAYADAVGEQERAQRIKENYVNETRFYIEMMKYLQLSGKLNDIVAQNTLDISSDQFTPHWQFIPNGGTLPLFLQQCEDNASACSTVTWPLSTLLITMDLHAVDWREKALALQHYGLTLFDQQHISMLPVFKKIDNDRLHLYLIFKKDGTTRWNMTRDQVAFLPGWLEGCGVFVANTPRAEHFIRLGAPDYYATYSLDSAAFAQIKHHISALLTNGMPT